MYTKQLSSPVSPILARAFERLIAAAAVFTPIALAAYAFAVSADPIVRTHIVVQGLEATVVGLLCMLAAGALYVLAAGSEPMHQIARAKALAASQSA